MEAHIDQLARVTDQASAGGGLWSWLPYLAAAVAVAAGLMLWIRGGSLLRPALSILAGMVFGVTVLILVPAVFPGSVVKPWHGVLVGASAGLGVAVLAYRWALAAASASVLGVLGVCMALMLLGGSGEKRETASAEGAIDLDAIGWQELTRAVHLSATEDRAPDQGEGFSIRLAGFGGEPQPAAPARKLSNVMSGSGTAGKMAKVFGKDEDDEGPSGPNFSERLSASTAAVVDAIPKGLRPFAEQACGQGATMLSRARNAWESAPQTNKAMIATAGALGVGLGGLFGLCTVEMAAAGLSSMLGAGLWLAGMAWLSLAMRAPWCALLDRPATQWLAIWVGATALGLVAQWWQIRPRKVAPPERRGLALRPM